MLGQLDKDQRGGGEYLLHCEEGELTIGNSLLSRLCIPSVSERTPHSRVGYQRG
jgi:hypothetical protein